MYPAVQSNVDTPPAVAPACWHRPGLSNTENQRGVPMSTASRQGAMIATTVGVRRSGDEFAVIGAPDALTVAKRNIQRDDVVVRNSTLIPSGSFVSALAARRGGTGNGSNLVSVVSAVSSRR